MISTATKTKLRDYIREVYPTDFAAACSAAETERTGMLAELLLKASFSEDLHPRDKNGRWVSRDLIADAKHAMENGDHSEADTLRNRVTDPHERAKLEHVLAGHHDLGRTKRGEARHAAGQKRQTRESAADAVRELRLKAVSDVLSVDDLRELTEHLPHLSTDDLRATRTALGASFKGDKRKEQMVGRLQAWAEGESGRLANRTPEELAADELASAGQAEVRQRREKYSIDEAAKHRAAMDRANAARRKGDDSLVNYIISRGGIDPKSAAFLANYGSAREAIADGIAVGVFRHGGHGLDTLAAEMVRSGHVLQDEHRSADEAVLNALKEGLPSAHANLQKQHDKDENDYYRSLQEADDAGANRPEVAESVRSGQEAERHEAEAAGDGEIPGAHRQDPRGAGGSEAPVDTSFEFGANDPSKFDSLDFSTDAMYPNATEGVGTRSREPSTFDLAAQRQREKKAAESVSHAPAVMPAAAQVTTEPTPAQAAREAISRNAPPFPVDINPPYTPGKITPEVLAAAHEEDVPLSSLTAAQSDTNGKYVEHLANGGEPKPGNGPPVFVRHPNGKTYIDDGHHRAAAEAVRGASTVRGKVVELDENGEPRKPTGAAELAAEHRADAAREAYRANPEDKTAAAEYEAAQDALHAVRGTAPPVDAPSVPVTASSPAAPPALTPAAITDYATTRGYRRNRFGTMVAGHYIPAGAGWHFRDANGKSVVLRESQMREMAERGQREGAGKNFKPENDPFSDAFTGAAPVEAPAAKPTVKEPHEMTRKEIKDRLDSLFADDSDITRARNAAKEAEGAFESSHRIDHLTNGDHEVGHWPVYGGSRRMMEDARRRIAGPFNTKEEAEDAYVRARSEAKRPHVEKMRSLEAERDRLAKVEDDHKELVASALAAGKHVPAEVLADYPELQPARTMPGAAQVTGGAAETPPASAADAASRKWNNNGDGTYTSTNGTVWRKAAKGGEVSPVTGAPFAGGALMPIHGLHVATPKPPAASTPTGGGGNVKPNENAKRSEPRAVQPLTPEQVEERKYRDEAARKAQEMQAGPLAPMTGLNSATGMPFRGNSAVLSTGPWKEYAEKMGEGKMQDILRQLPPPTDPDELFNYNDQLNHPQDFKARGGTKKHLKQVPSSADARYAIQHALQNAKNVDDVHRLHRILSEPASAPAPAPAAVAPGVTARKDVTVGDLRNAGDSLASALSSHTSARNDAEKATERDVVHRAAKELAGLAASRGQQKDIDRANSMLDRAEKEAGWKGERIPNAAKQPWQMTPEEFMDARYPEIEQMRRSEGNGARDLPRRVTDALREHKQHVEAALNRGDVVSPENLQRHEIKQEKGNFVSSPEWNTKPLAMQIAGTHHTFWKNDVPINWSNAKDATKVENAGNYLKRHGGDEVSVEVRHGGDDRIKKRYLDRVKKLAEHAGYDVGEPVTKMVQGYSHDNSSIVTLRKKASPPALKAFPRYILSPSTRGAVLLA